jgi:hypothetical protein
MPLVGAAGFVLFALICYWPITRFFFAQDDFVFLERASQGIGESLSSYFNTRPGQFRPLTKGLYFLGMWPVFGLNAFPYHLVSIVLHAANAFLVGVLLRRMGISTIVSWLCALLFAGHLGHFEAVNWISCVQQLIGGLTCFAALILGLDALSGRRRHAAAGAAIAYALSLSSYEQGLASPMALLAWQWLRHGWRASLSAVRGPVLPMLVLLAVYCVYMFGVRGIPDKGPYVMSVGWNVLDNLRVYTGITFSFWLIYPVTGLPKGFTVSHAVWMALVVFHVWRGTHRDLLFGVACFLLLLAPVLFTAGHNHSFHLYLPAIGAMFILATAADSLAAMAAFGRRGLATVAIVLAVVVMSASVFAARKNFYSLISKRTPLPHSFVLRRAILAERVCRDVSSRWSGGARLALVYGGRKRANWLNIESSIAKASALRLVLNQPHLDVRFVPPAQKPVANDPNETVILVTELGECYTPAEWAAGHEKEPAAPAEDENDE